MQPVVKKRRHHKNFTDKLNKIVLSLRSITPCVSDYMIFIQVLICKHKYITGDYMLTSSEIYFELKYSTLISNLYGLMRPILYIIYVAPYCKCTVPLVRHCVITNVQVYGVSYLYSLCLTRMTLSPTL